MKLLSLLLILSLCLHAGLKEDRNAARKLFDEGNFKEAYEAYRKLVLDRDNTGFEAGEDFNQAARALQNLNRINEYDALRTEALALRPADWAFTVGLALYRPTSAGHIIDGTFTRGYHHGPGAAYINVTAQDRLTLLRELIARPAPARGSLVSNYYRTIYSLLIEHPGRDSYWRLQILTDLSQSPDYTTRIEHSNFNTPGIPVDAQGNPVFFKTPASWQDAANDGERARWALEKLAQAGEPELALQYRAVMAKQLFEITPYEITNDGLLKIMRSLSDQEVLAPLATGTRRLTLPDDENPIYLWKKLADTKHPSYSHNALWTLHDIYSTRFQYDKALDCLKTLLATCGKDEIMRKRTEAEIRNIAGEWCTFGDSTPQVAGQNATCKLYFRNARQADFTAQTINLERLVADTWDFIGSSPKQPDWSKMSFTNLDDRLNDPKSRVRYLGQTVAQWKLGLTPADGHLDTIADITTPLKDAGAYLVTCTMPDGHVCRTIVLLQQLQLVTRSLQDGDSLWQLLDAATGRPVSQTKLDCLAYVIAYDNKTHKEVLKTRQFTKTTDDNGCITLPQDELILKDAASFGRNRYDQLLLRGKTADGRILYHGLYLYGSVINWQMVPGIYPKSYILTDRPLYRPGQTVHIKLWTAYAGYGSIAMTIPPTSTVLTITDPLGNKIHQTATLKLDEYGGADYDFTLPDNAQLGDYRVSDQYNGYHFRVEEYRKPEYSVTVNVPEKPVMLGEKIPVKITARYYFGAPVTEGTVSLEIRRSRMSCPWHPVARWDWLFAPGYWWYTPDYPWYRGWDRWGCSAEWLFQRGWNEEMPEVVLNTNGQLNADGTFTVQLDTALAQGLYGNHDQRYAVTATVRDQSRRTIVGNGSIIAAVQPFRVYAWLNRGYLQVGDKADVTVSARTADGRPVAGKSMLTLYRVHYDKNGDPEETAVQSWPLAMPADGMLRQAFTGTQAGQYRLACTVTDEAGHTAEGAVIFSVIGPGNDGRNYRYNALELIPDKGEYAPGDTVKLLVNTEQADSTVTLFIRPRNGAVSYPRILSLQGKNTTVEIPVTADDMPNMFLEAYTLANGTLHTALLQIRIPPAKNILDIALKPDQETYLPGAKGQLALNVTDETGAPVKATLAVAVYDKSLEAIAASRLQNIRDFFWKWFNIHFIHQNESFPWDCTMTPFEGEEPMAFLSGVFGLFMPMGTTEALFRHQLVTRGRPYRRRERGRSQRALGDGAMMGVKMAAAPAPEMKAKAVPAMAEAPMEMADAVAANGGALGANMAGGDAGQPVTLRTNFADTALWIARVDTDEQGHATLPLTMPENLTTWKIQAWAMGHETKVGQASAEVVTARDFILRLQAPRFFVEKDLVVLSANIHNFHDTPRQTAVTLELDGGCLTFTDEPVRSVTVPAKGETRVDWRVKAVKDGTAVIRMKAVTNDDSDAVQQSFPVLVHGADKSVMTSLAMQPDQTSATIAFTVPEQRRIDSTKLEIHWSPSLALAMVDALPYLIAYPYGCTEQTLNRFLPAVQTQQTLTALGISLEDVAKGVANLNSQEHGDSAVRKAQWKRYQDAAVFSDAELDKIITTGVRDLESMQCGDGGWGWFAGFGEHSGPHTTALVAQGLLLAARRCSVKINERVLARGLQWLKNYQLGELEKLRHAEKKVNPWKPYADHLDVLLYRVLAEACALKALPSYKELDEMETYLMRDKTRLSPAGLALLGLGLHYRGHQDACAQVIRNLRQYVEEDHENQTAWLRLPGYWWYWYGDEIETQAAFLKLLAEHAPQDPLASRLVKYLLNNRKNATYWRSTRDTAACLDAFATYARQSGETSPDMTVTVKLDGKPIATSAITARNLFNSELSCLLNGKDVPGGRHQLTFEKTGKGPLYITSDIRYFSLEDTITAAGLEVRVQRTVSRLIRDDRQQHTAGARGQVLQKQTEHFRREVLKDGDSVASGDLLEVELVLESKNDYEYLLLEDWKAAGTEPVENRSGYNGNTMGAYVEFRDTRTAFFIRTLPRGRSSVSYRLRAETPGTFSALPAQIQALYAPELHGNANELKITITE